MIGEGEGVTVTAGSDRTDPAERTNPPDSTPGTHWLVVAEWAQNEQDWLASQSWWA